MTTVLRSAAQDPWTAAGLILSVAQAGLAAYVARYGAEGPVPIRYDLAGNVIGWGDRGVITLVLAGMAVLTFVLTVFIARRMAKGDLTPGTRMVLDVGRFSMLVGLAFATMVIVAVGMGEMASVMQRFDVLRIALALAWAIMTVAGAVLGKAAPTRLVGLPMFLTLNDRDAWDRANRMAGRVLFLGGIVGVCAQPLLPTLLSLMLLVGMALAAVLAAMAAARVGRA